MKPVLQSVLLPFCPVSEAQEGPYEGAMARAWDRVRTRAAQLPYLRQAATQTVEALIAQDPPQRWLLVRNCGRYGSWLVADQLLLRCQQLWLDAPEEALELAKLCLHAVERGVATEGSAMVMDLKAKAWGYHGACAALLGLREPAKASLFTADECRRRGTGDRLLAAELVLLEASFCTRMGQEDRALVLLDRALRLFLKAGNHHLAGKTLLQKGALLVLLGRCREASWLLHQGLHWIDPEVEPGLLLAARRNLARCALAQGESDRSRILFKATACHSEPAPSEVVDRRQQGLGWISPQPRPEGRCRNEKVLKPSPEGRSRYLRVARGAH